MQKRQAIFDMQHKKIIKLEYEQNIIEKEMKKIDAEITDLAEIIKALGKDGLQALLIEQALPEGRRRLARVIQPSGQMNSTYCRHGGPLSLWPARAAVASRR